MVGCTVLVGICEKKRPVGRLTRRWGDNIKMDLKESRSESMVMIDRGQNREKWRAV
jgi:hypothetical protein